jgi:CHAT domain-containing protein
MALVVRPDGARVVRLGPRGPIEAACARLELGRAPKEAAGAGRGLDLPAAGATRAEDLAALAKLVVEPLNLGPETTRLIVCPHGALGYVPFALLAGGREVVYVPSGTTYLLLRGEADARGDGVLAVGYPDCGAETIASSVFHRGGTLGRLPGSREEALTVGSRVLLGAEATERGFERALAEAPRWRAVHLACHGLVDPERPVFSSLALTPAAGDDGFLTTLEVFRMRIPADLVALSACETGRGRILRTEGVVGFVRAFLYAGAPRVIVSLWKVDDEATRALMVKFYELWNPKDGAKGLPAATALRRAQEHVASQEKWKDPYYWAAWQLWGLPE